MYHHFIHINLSILNKYIFLSKSLFVTKINSLVQTNYRDASLNQK